MNEEMISFVEHASLESALNRLPEQFGGGRIFNRPIVGVAAGGDPIFSRYKKVVSPEHRSPPEIWLDSGLSLEDDETQVLSVLSIAFPYVRRIRDEGAKAVTMPPDIYSLGRNYANDFISDIQNRTVAFLKDRGYRAMAPSMSESFRILSQKEAPQFYSTWSERHIAFACGLGTFSLHEGLITEVGCNVRFGSIITDAPLEATPRKSDEPYANCLHYTSGECRKCAERCPGDAIDENGHDKVKCYAYGQIVAKEMSARLAPTLRPREQKTAEGTRVSYAVGCAFCQFGVPCTGRNPTGPNR